jgi:hypothetical protein
MNNRIKVTLLLVAVALGATAGLTFFPRNGSSISSHTASSSLSARSLAQLPTVVNGQQVIDFAISPTGQVAIATSRGDVFLYGLPGSPSPGIERGVWASPGTTGLMVFSGNGQELAGATTDGAVWEWNPENNRTWLNYVSGVTTGLSFTESASLALNSSGSLLAVSNVGVPSVYRQQGDLLSPYHVNYVDNQAHMVFPAPVFSGNGKYLTETGSTGIQSWSVATGVSEKIIPQCSCVNAVLSSDLSTSVMDGGDFVQASDLKNGHIIDDWPSKEIGILALSSDGKVLAWTEGNNSINVTYTYTDPHTLSLNLNDAGAGNLEFGLGGRLLMAASGSGAAKVWIIGTQKIIFGRAPGFTRSPKSLQLGRLAGDFADGTGWGEAEPSTIYNGGDPTGLVSHIKWKSWGGAQALGTGMSDYVGPDESVATGTQEPVTVVAFDVGPCGGVVMYRAVEWFFSGHNGSFNPKQYEDVCAGTYVGSP